jgi:hypothetical protein
MGHFERECPKGKGKGKGGKGEGKGFGKGVGKGFGKGDGKGWGKSTTPFPYACHSCGKIGHRAADCRSKGYGANELECEEQPNAQQPARVIGGIGWSLCAVEVDKKVIKLKNKFQVLGEKNNIGIWDDMADMVDSEDDNEKCGGGIGKDFEGFQEIEFKQKVKKKIVLRK